MKKLKYFFEMILLDLSIILGCTFFSVPAYGQNPTPKEIEVIVSNKIDVTKAEINLLKQKVKVYNDEQDKKELAEKEENLVTLKKELKIIRVLVKTEEKLEKSKKQTNELQCKYDTLINQGINIYKKEK